ncbi:glycosyltransferase family 2 protein [Halomicronema sp. CCY15110]|uniref:glycosyltransferase family 2 protein n=1 Tax=Halomicronema sp. CCY15110 TaxID=2767773 RepID=UPI00194F4C1C|nr:glycosyltransferase family 2 protein [Halomicronema sp. CCY15110]
MDCHKSRTRITIGITTFNAASTIEDVIQSALKQTYQDIEILIVDDCSDDSTLAIVTEMAESDARITVGQNVQNLGVAATRNRILALARGEFIAFFDDDDISLPDRLERQLNRILEYERQFANGAMVLCHTARLVKYPDGSALIHPTIGQREGQLAPYGMALARRAVLGTPLEDSYGSCPTCSQLARLSTYQAVGGFDSAFRRAEDSDLLVRVAKAGGHVVGIADPLVIQTMTPTSDKSLADERYYTLKWLAKHRDIADAEGLYDFHRQWLSLKHTWLERNRGQFIVGLARVSVTYPIATLRRFVLSWRNFKINRSFRQFHAAPSSDKS